MPRPIHRMPTEASSATPLEIAMHRAATLTPDERREVLAPSQAAFDAFRRGMGTDAHWARLVDAINVGLELTRRQIASDHGPTFDAAGQALTAAFERHQLSGSWTLRGPEIAALDDALFVHQIQLDHASRGELGAAVTRVINRTKAALQGNAGPGTTVCVPALRPHQPQSSADRIQSAGTTSTPCGA